jgi:replication factor C subunit 2/4
MEDHNILSIDGYDDDSCEQVDISGSLTSDIKSMNRQIYEQLPWIEKYRPKTIDDMILDQNTLAKIKRIIADKDMPNIIITGAPGIGKTTTIKNIAKALYREYVDDATLELNASGDRGIKTVEDAITNFCKKAVNISVKHKMIILDEADNITSKAQHSINKKMQEYNTTTRFAFTCNKSSDIIEAIQSRCIILRYPRLPTSQVIDKLRYICEKEKLSYQDDALNEIAIISQGDMRSAINTLQKVYNGSTAITVDNIYQICDKPQPTVLLQILLMCKEMKIKEVFKMLSSLKSKGYSHSDITLGMINVLKIAKCDGLTEKDKIYMLKNISDTAYAISRGINTDLQLYACVSNIIDGYMNNAASITDLLSI